MKKNVIAKAQGAVVTGAAVLGLATTGCPGAGVWPYVPGDKNADVSESSQSSGKWQPQYENYGQPTPYQPTQPGTQMQPQQQPAGAPTLMPSTPAPQPSPSPTLAPASYAPAPSTPTAVTNIQGAPDETEGVLVIQSANTVMASPVRKYTMLMSSFPNGGTVITPCFIPSIGAQPNVQGVIAGVSPLATTTIKEIPAAQILDLKSMPKNQVGFVYGDFAQVNPAHVINVMIGNGVVQNFEAPVLPPTKVGEQTLFTSCSIGNRR